MHDRPARIQHDEHVAASALYGLDLLFLMDIHFPVKGGQCAFAKDPRLDAFDRIFYRIPLVKVVPERFFQLRQTGDPFMAG